MTEAQLIPTRDAGEHYDLLEAVESDALAEQWFARTPSRRTGPALVRVLRPQPAVCADARSRDAFLEALLAQSAVHHPLLVRVLDIASRERPYAVFELVEAIPIEDLLAGARATSYTFSLPATVRIALDIAAALEAVHKAGLAHGDVSNTSVLVAASGFGLLSPTGLGVAACRLRREIVTPSLAYKPKEQLERAQTSAAADVFALGALVFEMLAGRPLFEGEGDALLAALTSGHLPRLDDVRSGIARPFADVVAQALAAEPGERFATANAFAIELERAAGPALAARADLGRIVARLASRDLAALRMTLTPLIEGRESLASFPAREELPAPDAPDPVTEISPKMAEAANAAAVALVAAATATGPSATGVLAAARREAEARRGAQTTPGNEPSVVIKDESSKIEVDDSRTRATSRNLRLKPADAKITKLAGPSEPAASSEAPTVASVVTDTDDELLALARSGATRKRQVIGAIALVAAAITGFAVFSQLGSADPPGEPEKAEPAATARPAAAAPVQPAKPETTDDDFMGTTAPATSPSATTESSSTTKKTSSTQRRAPAPARAPPAAKDTSRAAARPAAKPAAAPRTKIPTGI